MLKTLWPKCQTNIPDSLAKIDKSKKKKKKKGVKNKGSTLVA